MLSVAKLAVGQEAYYEQQVARGLDDYYAGRGESPGIWAGGGADGLGLVGVVGDGDLGKLLLGTNPANDERLRTPVRERIVTVRTLDIESGEWREEQKRLTPVSGYDLVFSCPKSVSVLHALADDERVRREISEAHEQAWQATLAYLEREACVVRRGRGGAIREHGQGFVAAAFRHRTSRAQDPHLHTHVIVANLARSSDGEWRALDGEAILKTYRLAAGYLYEAQLRHELTRRLGLEWTEPAKGMGEIAGVPDEAIRAFSTRRQSLIGHMEALGTEGFAASRVAALATREAKEQVELPRLHQEWQARASEHGLGRREIEALVDRSLRERHVEHEQLAAWLFGREGLTEKRTTFTMPELVEAVAGSLAEGASVNEVLDVAGQLARLPGVELIERGETPGRPARFTTRELLAVEREALDLALAGRGVRAPSLERRSLARLLTESGAGLTGEQRMLVLEASAQLDRVVCVVGVAGAGKTTALRALADAHRESGFTVLGAAPSGRAADELQAATDVPSRTLHRLLLDAEREGGLPHRCVLVVDEAGMAETRVLAPLLRFVNEAEGKAILVGDPAQLPAVGAGGLFPALCERLGTVELTRNRRQRDFVERAGLARLRAGDAEPYLAHAAARGHLNVDDDETAAKRRLLEDWWQAAAHDLAGTVMLAYRRGDARELNEAARALLLESRQLGAEPLTLGGRDFRLGDRVLCRRNDPRLGIRNGTRGTVVDVDSQAKQLTLETSAGAHRPIPASYAADHLEHAYALTGHAAQGATLERAFVLLRDEGALREWGYVACSRARTETRLYLIGDRPEREHHARPLDQRDSPARLAGALQRSAVEPLALEQAKPAASATTRRAFERARRERERALELAEQRLASAQEKLRSLGRAGHRRERARLKAEISVQQAALRLAREQLAAVPLEPPRPRRTTTQQPRLERERPVLRVARELDRGIELEL